MQRYNLEKHYITKPNYTKEKNITYSNTAGMTMHI